jgi:uncharacterized repeat protein (TIGR02543 family)
LALTSGQTVGGIATVQNAAKFYRVLLKEPGRVNVTLNWSANELNNPKVRFLDANGTELKSDWTWLVTPFKPFADLEAGTYYIEISSNSGNTGPYTLTASFGEPAAVSFTITAKADTGGTVSGSGTFAQNASVALVATPKSGYTFDGWYEGSSRVSTNANYAFAATANRTLEARFVQSPAQTPVPVSTPQPQPAQTGAPAGTPQPQLPQLPQLPQIAAAIDNPHSDWAQDELGRAFEEDLVPPLLKDPETDLREPITREEFAGIAVLTYENLSGTRVRLLSSNPFTDTNDIYARMAYDAGLMVGISADSCAPDMILNRETAATALTRVFKKWHFNGWSFADDGLFTLNYTKPGLFADDSNISGWARDSVYFMAANGIILGFTDNTFRPSNTANAPANYANATREQALIIALRLVENLGR